MKRSILALPVAVLALSAAGVGSAQALTSVSATGAAPPDYMASCAAPTVDSRTHLVLEKHIVRQGNRNSATVHVRSAAAIDPQGSVSLAIYQANSGTGLTQALQNGVVTLALPRRLDVGQYSVRATYFPADCSKWMRSRSTIEQLTVLAQ